LLFNLELTHNQAITKGEAAILLNKYFNQPASEKQLWYLNHYEIHPFPDVLSKREATKVIQKFKEMETAGVA
jgi:hypothetical protein